MLDLFVVLGPVSNPSGSAGLAKPWRTFIPTLYRQTPDRRTDGRADSQTHRHTQALERAAAQHATRPRVHVAARNLKNELFYFPTRGISQGREIKAPPFLAATGGRVANGTGTALTNAGRDKNLQLLQGPWFWMPPGGQVKNTVRKSKLKIRVSGATSTPRRSGQEDISQI